MCIWAWKTTPPPLCIPHIALSQTEQLLTLADKIIQDSLQTKFRVLTVEPENHHKELSVKTMYSLQKKSC